MQHPVTAFVSDLIFATKISSTGRALDLEVGIVRTPDALAARLEAHRGGLLLIDLNAANDDPTRAVSIARGATHPPHIVCFLSHVQTELAEQARQAGADEVMPRSAFVAGLPNLLRGMTTDGLVEGEKSDNIPVGLRRCSG